MKISKTERMKELVTLLNKAGRAYYQEAREIMSNFEYDKLYDELVSLEEETGITLTGSPTVNVGYEVLSELPKEQHEGQMLSLNKTKDVGELIDFAGTEKVMVSWKLDGLTIVLTYRNGELFKAVTRGNGEIGEVVTNNARMFRNIPLKIGYTGELVVRGEAVISYSEFEKINREIPDMDAKYKNPRNLCSGSVRQLNNEITAKRNVSFFAFSLVRPEEAGNVELNSGNSRQAQQEWLKDLGFEIVEYKMADRNTMADTVQYFASQIEKNDYPSDGLVVIFDNIAYGQSLGATAKFPRDSIAFKWEDEIKTTILQEMEWSASRTGLINPVAIFDPVELEGTTVSRASVHNISVMKGLELGIGDEIQVYKANMIIPQIAENLTRSGLLPIPAACPVCEGATEIKSVNDAESLYCTNAECPAKQIKAFSHFVSRNAMNIEGLSEATLEKFVSRGLLEGFSRIFHLDEYEEEITELEGFGEKSFHNLMESIKRARKAALPNVIYSLGIANVGLSNAKVICKAFHNDIGAIMGATEEQLNAVDGIGPVIAKTFSAYFRDADKMNQVLALLDELEIEAAAESDAEQSLEGKTFVITGSVEVFKNRNEMKAFIEERGGKVTGSVTSKTDYLINNDAASVSSKNKKAKELGVPILTEQDFLQLIKGE